MSIPVHLLRYPTRSFSNNQPVEGSYSMKSGTFLKSEAATGKMPLQAASNLENVHFLSKI